MKTLLIAAATAAALILPLGVSIGTSTSADAQVRIRAGEDGVGVRVGPRVDRRRVRDRCRTVRTKIVRPSGRVITETRRVCR